MRSSVVMVVGVAVLVSMAACAPASTPSTPVASSAAVSAKPAGALPLPHDLAPIDAGTYQLTSFAVPLTIAVPDEWEGFSTPSLAAVTRDLGNDGEAALSFWIVRSVYEEPCELRFADPPIGATADDLATALADIPNFTSERSTGTLDGVDAHFLDMRGPVNASCDVVGLWRSSGGVCRCLSPGLEHNRIWILDVDGVRVLINAEDLPATAGDIGTAPQVLDELQGIIDSIDINPSG